MMQNKFLFGITGGSGTGKTTVSDIFRENGIEVIDCDIIAREITEKNHPCLKELTDMFGSEILKNSGELDRKKLGSIVFTSTEKLNELNRITHKYILKRVFELAENSASTLTGVDGAVLFESGLTDNLEKVIGVLADRKIRIKRITERDCISVEMAENRINSQKIDKFYIDNCDYIIYNNNSKLFLENQVKEVVLKLKKESEKKGIKA